MPQSCPVIIGCAIFAPSIFSRQIAFIGVSYACSSRDGSKGKLRESAPFPCATARPFLEGEIERNVRQPKQERTVQRGVERTIGLDETVEELSRSLAEQGGALGRIKLDSAARKFEEVRDNLEQGLLIMILGEFSTGKSTFVNAFLGEEATSTSILPETATINILRYGERRTRIHRLDGTITEIPGYAREQLKAQAAEIEYAEIFAPIPRLETFSLIDTPGLNSVFEEHERTTRNFLHRADMIVWLFDAFKLGKLGERAYLDFVRDYGAKTVAVVNKIDQVPEDQHPQLRAFLEEHFGGYFQRIFLLSARRTLEARKRTGMETGKPDDGFSELEAYLFEEIAPRRTPIKIRATCRTSEKIARDAQTRLEEARQILIEKKHLLDEISEEMKGMARRLAHTLRETIHEETDRFFGEVEARARRFIDAEVRVKRALYYLSTPLDTKIRFEEEVVGEKKMSDFFSRVKRISTERFTQEWGRYTDIPEDLIEFTPALPAMGEEVEQTINDVFFQTVERVLAVIFMTIVLLILFVAFWSFWLVLVIPFAGLGVGLAISSLTLFRYRRAIIRRILEKCSEYRDIVERRIAAAVERANETLHAAALDRAAGRILGSCLGSGEAEERIASLSERIEALRSFRETLEKILHELPDESPTPAMPLPAE
ncbi:MAG: hypothetical protein D6812_06100 [Deltaproteobacteria bacterium]|nr:MAG: hypothetical protein D6812_06100 [Deltaproteobacteria bacterium]